MGHTTGVSRLASLLPAAFFLLLAANFVSGDTVPAGCNTGAVDYPKLLCWRDGVQIACPSGITNLTWTPPPTYVAMRIPFTISYTLEVSESISSRIVLDSNGAVASGNVQGCEVEMGLCSPFIVAPYNARYPSANELTFTGSLTLSRLSNFSVVAYVTFLVANANAPPIRWDVMRYSVRRVFREGVAESLASAPQPTNCPVPPAPPPLPGCVKGCPENSTCRLPGNGAVGTCFCSNGTAALSCTAMKPDTPSGYLTGFDTTVTPQPPPTPTPTPTSAPTPWQSGWWNALDWSANTPVPSGSTEADVGFLVASNIETFNQTAFLYDLSAQLKVPVSQLQLVKMLPGSVVLEIKMPAPAAQTLDSVAQTSPSNLSEMGIIDYVQKGQQSTKTAGALQPTPPPPPPATKTPTPPVATTTPAPAKTTTTQPPPPLPPPTTTTTTTTLPSPPPKPTTTITTTPPPPKPTTTTTTTTTTLPPPPPKPTTTTTTTLPPPPPKPTTTTTTTLTPPPPKPTTTTLTPPPPKPTTTTLTPPPPKPTTTLPPPPPKPTTTTTTPPPPAATTKPAPPPNTPKANTTTTATPPKPSATNQATAKPASSSAASQTAPPTNGSGMTSLQMTVEGDASTFDPDAFQQTLGNLLGIPPEQVEITYVAPGSVVVMVDVPDAAAGTLQNNVTQEDLNNVGILDYEVLGPVGGSITSTPQTSTAAAEESDPPIAQGTVSSRPPTQTGISRTQTNPPTSTEEEDPPIAGGITSKPPISTNPPTSTEGEDPPIAGVSSKIPISTTDGSTVAGGASVQPTPTTTTTGTPSSTASPQQPPQTSDSNVVIIIVGLVCGFVVVLCCCMGGVLWYVKIHKPKQREKLMRELGGNHNDDSGQNSGGDPQYYNDSSRIPLAGAALDQQGYFAQSNIQVGDYGTPTNDDHYSRGYGATGRYGAYDGTARASLPGGSPDSYNPNYDHYENAGEDQPMVRPGPGEDPHMRVVKIGPPEEDSDDERELGRIKESSRGQNFNGGDMNRGDNASDSQTNVSTFTDPSVDGVDPNNQTSMTSVLTEELSQSCASVNPTGTDPPNPPPPVRALNDNPFLVTASVNSLRKNPPGAVQIPASTGSTNDNIMVLGGDDDEAQVSRLMAMAAPVVIGGGVAAAMVAKSGQNPKRDSMVSASGGAPSSVMATTAGVVVVGAAKTPPSTAAAQGRDPVIILGDGNVPASYNVVKIGGVGTQSRPTSIIRLDEKPTNTVSPFAVVKPPQVGTAGNQGEVGVVPIDKAAISSYLKSGQAAGNSTVPKVLILGPDPPTNQRPLSTSSTTTRNINPPTDKFSTMASEGTSSGTLLSTFDGTQEPPRRISVRSTAGAHSAISGPGTRDTDSIRTARSNFSDHSAGPTPRKPENQFLNPAKKGNPSGAGLSTMTLASDLSDLDNNFSSSMLGGDRLRDELSWAGSVSSLSDTSSFYEGAPSDMRNLNGPGGFPSQMGLGDSDTSLVLMPESAHAMTSYDPREGAKLAKKNSDPRQPALAGLDMSDDNINAPTSEISTAIGQSRAGVAGQQGANVQKKASSGLPPTYNFVYERSGNSDRSNRGFMG